MNKNDAFALVMFEIAGLNMGSKPAISKPELMENTGSNLNEGCIKRGQKMVRKYSTPEYIHVYCRPQES